MLAVKKTFTKVGGRGGEQGGPGEYAFADPARCIVVPRFGFMGMVYALQLVAAPRQAGDFARAMCGAGMFQCNGPALCVMPHLQRVAIGVFQHCWAAQGVCRQARLASGQATPRMPARYGGIFQDQPGPARRPGAHCGQRALGAAQYFQRVQLLQAACAVVV